MSGRSPTKFYCMFCEEITPCRSVHGAEYGYSDTGRYFKTDHPDIQYYQRLRVCDECGEEFQTAEVESRHISELVRLRDEMKALKESALIYLNDAKQAQTSQSKIVDFFEKLKAK